MDDQDNWGQSVFHRCSVCCLWWWCRVHMALVLPVLDCSVWWFALWLERRIGGCNGRWRMKFYMLCQARGHRGRCCLCFQQWECYHDSLPMLTLNIFHMFSMGVQLDRLGSLQICSLLRPWTCKPTEKSEGVADKPQGFISVLFSLGIVWRSWEGWELKINVLVWFFSFYKYFVI